MKRQYVFMVVLALLLSLSLASPLAAQEEGGPPQVGLRPDAPTYALHGPYWVGTMEFVMEDEAGSLALTAWYPARNPENAPEAIIYSVRSDASVRQYTDPDRPLPIEGHALLDGEPDRNAAPYPLVVFSHAYTASKEFAYTIAEHLASYGFVVLAPDHIGDTWDAVYAGSIKRMPEVKRVITYAESLTAPDGELAGLIDMEHVAVGGWSAGGMITYGIAGAPIDWASVEQYCGEVPDAPECSDLPSQEMAALAAAGLETEPDGLWPALSDSRVDAIFPLAGTVDLYGERGLGAVNVPMLTLFGTVDPSSTWMYPAYDQVSSTQKAQVVFEGANHFIFSTDCGATPWLAEIGAYQWCSDAVWDMSRAQDLTNHFTTAFLLAELYGDEDAAAALAPENVQFPGVQYEAEGF